MIDTVITDAAKVERLALLGEEAGEVNQVIGKILRHGYESFHPNTPEITNRALLEEEIADFLIIVDLMIQEGDVNRGRIAEIHRTKKEKKNKYLHNNKIR